MKRCSWATTPLGIAYHDTEWGVPVHDDRVLFEFLILEGAQAGLSWETILNKRENYRKVLMGFDPSRISKFKKEKLNSLMKDPGIVRNRLKIDSTVTNAAAFLAVQREFGSFDRFLWDLVGGKPLVGRFRSFRQLPARTGLSDALSRELKRRGFRFVGPTTAYAFMQAMGLVNDHLDGCHVRGVVEALRGELEPEEARAGGAGLSSTPAPPVARSSGAMTPPAR